MAESEPFEDPELPRDARLDALDARLDQARRAEAKRTGGEGLAQPSYYRSGAYRVLSVLVAYPAGSALIGYAAGRFFGKPLLWVVMLFVGFAVAMWEVWKLSKGAGQGARDG
jgi:F0F1-type ATP synthase assembly protein I